MTKPPLVGILIEQRAREFGTDTKAAEQMELSQRGVLLVWLVEPWK